MRDREWAPLPRLRPGPEHASLLRGFALTNKRRRYPNASSISAGANNFIHTFAPGPEGVELPFTQVPLQVLNVEPSTIADFKGATALAYHVGKAKGSDGKTYNLETDIRVMEGRYVSVEGTRRRGTFAEI